MPHYLVEISHTDKDCLQSLQMIVAYGLHILNYSWFGCSADVHTGWVDLEANSASEARNVLPPVMRSRARVVEVRRYTAEQIRGMHAQ